MGVFILRGFLGYDVKFKLIFVEKNVKYIFLGLRE